MVPFGDKKKTEERESVKIFTKRIIQDFAILLLVMTGINNLFAALPLKFAEHFNRLYTKYMDPNAVSVHHMLSLFLGILMLLLAYRLFKRVRLAWFIEIIVLVANITLHVIRHQSLSYHFALIQLFILVVLIASYKDFSRRTDGMTVKKALLFIGTSLFLVILNATIGLFLMKTNIRNIHHIFDALISSVQLLVFMNTEVLSITGKAGALYADSLITVNWICILSSFALLLKPLVYSPLASRHDHEKARQLIMKFGQNPISYLAMENDKKLFLGKEITGVCAYQIVANVFIICGDMICEKKDGFIFLTEILTFCKQNDYDILLLNVTDYFTELYKIAGFGVVKYGEDSCFKLEEYNLVGGKVAKVRAAINHANNAGITVHEYKPLIEKNPELESEIDEITAEWLAEKGGDELGFMLGGTGLAHPLDRRYFYALDAENKMLGFVVFLPYLGGKGYMADVTRRRKNAPQGVLEKTIYEAFMIMKAEGAVWGNMGLSPLYNVADSDRAALTERVFSYIYENMNNGYNFKALHHAKKKYAPTDWQPRYLAYYPKLFSLNLGYAMLKVQMPNQITKTILSSIVKKEEESE